MTTDEAKTLYDSAFWEPMSAEERATFQLFQPLLCMPFGVFHEAVEKTLGRPVWTHEFATPDNLRRELRGEKPAPSMDEILSLIPADKRVIVVTV